MKYRIPIAEPNIGDLERKYLLEAYDSGWISSKGTFINRFEDKFAEWLDVNYAITCSSGTAALHLALLALGANEPEYGKQIFVTPSSYAAAGNMIIECGKIPTTMEMTEISISIHNYGYVSDDEISDSSLMIIEDCAEALGTKYKGRFVGSFGDISTFSFYGNKTMTTGEGGMVCTNRPDYAIKIKHLKNQAMIEPYIHDVVGYNYRMTNMQAAIGCAQLERIEELLDKKRQVMRWYDENISLERIKEPTSEEVLWMNVFKVNNQVKFRRYMDQRGIETRPGFNPAQNIVCLPSGTTLTESQVKEVCEIANAYS